METQSVVNVAIDGNCGAGKTTLASIINGMYDCNVFHMDNFFLTPELRTNRRLKEIGGNVDYARFKQEVIDKLGKGQEFKYRIYDCRQMAFTKAITVTPKKLNIIEGCYSMHPTLINYYDLKIFLYIDIEEQKRRILKRNGEAMLERFLTEWIPLENKYFNKYKIQEQCDLVINTK